MLRPKTDPWSFHVHVFVFQRIGDSWCIPWSYDAIGLVLVLNLCAYIVIGLHAMDSGWKASPALLWSTSL